MGDFTLAAAQVISRPGDVEANVTHHVAAVAAAAALGADLIVFPELSLTGYARSLTRADAVTVHDARLAPLRRAAGAYGIIIVAGAPLAVASGLRIGAITFFTDGKIRVYEKQHLHDGEEAAFAPGRGGAPVRVAGETVALAVCADTSHPEHACAASEVGATVYAASSFITPSGYLNEAARLQTYARGHGMTVLMANYGGPTGGWPAAGRSAVWTADGTLVAVGPEAGAAIVLAHRLHGVWTGHVVQP